MEGEQRIGWFGVSSQRTVKPLVCVESLPNSKLAVNVAVRDVVRRLFGEATMREEPDQ